MLGHYIKHQILMQERHESDLRLNTLCKLPANTFAAIYAECEPVWAGCWYNGVYYGEHEIYAASLRRDEGYEEFL